MRTPLLVRISCWWAEEADTSSFFLLVMTGGALDTTVRSLTDGRYFHIEFAADWTLNTSSLGFCVLVLSHQATSTVACIDFILVKSNRAIFASIVIALVSAGDAIALCRLDATRQKQQRTKQPRVHLYVYRIEQSKRMVPINLILYL